MNWRRILVGTVVLGIVGNLIDYVLNTYLLTGLFDQLSGIANPSPPLMWYIIGDFALAFMLMLAWDLVGNRFGTGAGGGFKFGLAAGLFVSFPQTLFWQMMLRDFPYATAWLLIVIVTVFYAIMGAIAGALDRPAKA